MSALRHAICVTLGWLALSDFKCGIDYQQQYTNFFRISHWYSKAET